MSNKAHDLLSVKQLPLIVIGAGPAGLMAAGTAAATGRTVWLLERTGTPGNKLRLTGQGRCNCANAALLPDFLTHCYSDRRWLNRLFGRFFTPDALDFFNRIGVATMEEEQGRIFPVSQSSQAVTAALLAWCHRRGVRILTRHRAVAVECVDKSIFNLSVQHADQRKPLCMPAGAVIIATGGCSYPQTGSSGDGYDLARTCGHTIREPMAALVKLLCTDQDLHACAGMGFSAARLDLWSSGKKIASRTGELLVTHNGLSGPAALSISREVSRLLNQGLSFWLTLDCVPLIETQNLNQELISELNRNGNKQIVSVMKKYVPLRLAQVICTRCGIAAEKKCHQITATQRKQIRDMLKQLPLDISGTGSLSEAMVTAGGVALTQVDPATCRSKLISNLYFAGEVLDCDADTGGYNLQIAFSTGYCAGMAAVKDPSRIIAKPNAKG